MSDDVTARSILSHALVGANPYAEAQRILEHLERHGWTVARIPEPRDPSGPKLGGQRQGGMGTAATAAELVVPRMGTQRNKVLAAIVVASARGDGYTDVEIGEHTGFPANSVRPRRVELVDAGWVHATDRRRRHNGREHVVWSLTPAARKRYGL